MRALFVFGFSCLSSWLYFKGGEGPKLVRRLGIPILCFLPLMWLYGGFSTTSRGLATLIASVALYGALTTYCKGDAEDVLWNHWALTGLLYGLSAIPMIWFISIKYFILRCIFLSLFTLIWSSLFTSVKWEAYGRGFVIITTLPILFF